MIEDASDFVDRLCRALGHTPDDGERLECWRLVTERDGNINVAALIVTDEKSEARERIDRNAGLILASGRGLTSGQCYADAEHHERERAESIKRMGF